MMKMLIPFCLELPPKYDRMRSSTLDMCRGAVACSNGGNCLGASATFVSTTKQKVSKVARVHSTNKIVNLQPLERSTCLQPRLHHLSPTKQHSIPSHNITLLSHNTYRPNTTGLVVVLPTPTCTHW